MRENLVVHTLRYLLAVSGFTMVYTAAFGICCRFYTKVFTPPENLRKLKAYRCQNGKNMLKVTDYA